MSVANIKSVEMDQIVIRLAGDSGDGMQLVGDQFTITSAMMGDEVATLPDYPSEIRAPAGTIFGVSGFQICFASEDVYTAGDEYDVLVAMNPAALKVNLASMKAGGTIIVNEDAFIDKNLEKAGYAENPLTSTELQKFKVMKVGMSKVAQKALEGGTMSPKAIDRCKNFVALGLMYSMFKRDKTFTNQWVQKKFKAKPELIDANTRALDAGWNLGESGEVNDTHYTVVKRKVPKKAGVYRNVTGNTAAALGLIAAAQRSGLKLFLGSYPITPATDIMHELCKHPDFATVFQAEDEIAGIGSAVGASFAGALAATTTSGPGMSLKSEFLNLAMIVELPLVIVNVQRGGPSTGLPTKTEQSDLAQAMWGRHGESPIAILASSTPQDCFDTVVEAARLAIKYMTPVIVLSDGYLGNGAGAWKVPKLEELPEIKANFRTDPTNFLPYERDPKTLARPWAPVGTPGLEHRIGGLEKEDRTGTVSANPLNHEKMTHLRAEKIARIADDIPPMTVEGNPNADILILGWGGTKGVIRQAVRNLTKQGVPVACAHLRHLNPLPRDLKPLLKKYKKVLIPENNMGQLWFMLRGEFLMDFERYSKVQGQPFRADEIEAKVRTLLEIKTGANS
ncbi:2-oxoacid:acceptor oxidoreductase subunit alpha [Bdellovibrionota bacterium FG-2]